MNPMVTVLMPVYNGSDYLEESIKSILHQSFKDYEFLILDDASTDGSVDIIRGYSDPRIRLVENSENMGQVPTMNRGVELAMGRYIARLDQDDVSLPGRLEQQMDFFIANPEYLLLGTSYYLIDSAGNHIDTCTAQLSDAAIRWQMLFDTAFCHSSVVFRKDDGKGKPFLYDPDFFYAEDYELWLRILRSGKGANLKAPLVCLRQHQTSTSSRHLLQQEKHANAIASKNIRNLMSEDILTDEETLELIDWYRHRPGCSDVKDLSMFCRYFDLMEALSLNTIQISRADTARLRHQLINSILYAVELKNLGSFLKRSRITEKLSLLDKFGILKHLAARATRPVRSRFYQDITHVN